MNEKRLQYVDIMRGIAITLVTTGHLLQFNGLPTNNPIFEFIYSFHMPLFFAISGYITHKVTLIENTSKLLSFYKKKSIAIALPFFVWTFFVNKYVLRESLEPLDLNYIKVSLLQPGLWFLKTLYLILIIYGLYNFIRYKLKERNELIKTGIASIISLFLFLFVFICKIESINFLMYAFMFMGGVMVSSFYKIEGLIQKDYIIAISCIAFFVLSTLWNLNGSIKDDLLKIIVSFLSFIILYNFAKRFKFYRPLNSLFQLFGKESLSIYLIQFHLCGIIDIQEINTIIKPLILFFLIIPIAMAINLICCWCSFAIKKNKYLALFLLGNMKTT